MFKDALHRLTDRLQYLNTANNRFWFDTRPNLRREMEERKRRFEDKDDVFPAIRERLQKGFSKSVFGGIHVFTASGDVPDDWLLRLVVLPPDAAFSRQEERIWRPAAESLLNQRGDQPRQKQNRLIFLAADVDSVGRLKDQVRSMLAWESIVTDYRENKIVLDNLMAKNAETSLSQAQDALQRMIRETYKWLLAPMQEARPGKGISELQWEHFPLNSQRARLHPGACPRPQGERNSYYRVVSDPFDQHVEDLVLETRRTGSKRLRCVAEDVSVSLSVASARRVGVPYSAQCWHRAP